TLVHQKSNLKSCEFGVIFKANLIQPLIFLLYHSKVADVHSVGQTDGVAKGVKPAESAVLLVKQVRLKRILSLGGLFSDGLLCCWRAV
ncbi:hypothetical protein PL75_07360, partial [Neisseria arctica]